MCFHTRPFGLYLSCSDKYVSDIAQSGSGWYFKTGSYLQSNTEKGDAPDAVGKVVLYQVDVTHT